MITNKTETISVPKFKEIAAAGDIKEVEIINNKNVNVFIKEDVIQSKYPQFKDAKFSKEAVMLNIFKPVLCASAVLTVKV